jgi:hypothetical protein
LLTYIPLDVALDPGDTLTLFPGCDLTNGPLGCLRWANCINQQADPFVPGQDARNINYREWGTPEPEPEGALGDGRPRSNHRREALLLERHCGRRRLWH